MLSCLSERCILPGSCRVPCPAGYLLGLSLVIAGTDHFRAKFISAAGFRRFDRRKHYPEDSKRLSDHIRLPKGHGAPPPKLRCTALAAFQVSPDLCEPCVPPQSLEASAGCGFRCNTARVRRYSSTTLVMFPGPHPHRFLKASCCLWASALSAGLQVGLRGTDNIQARRFIWYAADPG